ncbi:outer membrane beta-barrel family protein [Pseudochryseolinea flava]|uniref:TonB-dependent receptor n=1 Tax=Pseudochryseolinea flava TaxID=2059302 RepID=A0A364XXP6_9BACT|nr:outer membrane beta-barrel family protein [Pseudochryseolinea flava]RAV99020.1 TonB-dependent receptor [Pseudochryseolinea flava]
MKRWLIAFALPLICFSTFAQSSIEGTIIDSVAQQPIAFSSIALYQESDDKFISGTVTDERGAFKLDKLSTGKYYLSISFLGYETRQVRNVSVLSNATTLIKNVTLSPTIKLLDAAIVEGQKITSYHTLDKQHYTASQFQNSQGGTATDVLKNLPSIAVNSEGEITLRGSSSFVVLLDGKPVQSEPSVILNQLQANNIERVEVITTPSSKYDPDGKSGIINIITKKGATDGQYWLINAQAGFPSVRDYGNEDKPLRFGGDVTFNYKKQKWNFSLAANYKRDDLAGYRDGEATTTLGDIRTTNPSSGERSYESYSYGLKTVVNYALNERSFIEAGFYGGKRSQFRTANIYYDQTRTNITTGQVANALSYFNKNLRERKGDFLVASLDYGYSFQDKSALLLSALYEKTILGGPTNNVDVAPNNEQFVYNRAIIEEENPLDGYRIKADYTKKITDKSKLEAGYQYRYLLHLGDFRYNQFDINNGWAIRNDLSNEIELKRTIHALYSQYSHDDRKFSYQAGLRLEYVDRVLTDDEEHYTFERVNLFPSASLLYTITQDLKLKAGYSKRINHTTSNMMNPFPARRHSEVLETGDPNLLPEYIDVSELGIIKDINDHSLSLTAYHRHVKNVINRVNDIYNDTILVRTFTNAGNANAWGAELSVDIKLTSWWTIFAGTNAYNYSIDGKLYNKDISRNGFNYAINGSSTFKLPSATTIQLAVNYTSATITAQGEDSRYLIPSVTVKKNILKGSGALSLQWQNIDLGMFDTNEQRITTVGENFYTTTNYIQETDIIRLNFSYQFNKLNKKVKFTESEFGEKEF